MLAQPLISSIGLSNLNAQEFRGIMNRVTARQRILRPSRDGEFEVASAFSLHAGFNQDIA